MGEKAIMVMANMGAARQQMNECFLQLCVYHRGRSWREKEILKMWQKSNFLFGDVTVLAFSIHSKSQKYFYFFDFDPSDNPCPSL